MSATNLCLDSMQFSIVLLLVSPISLENPEPTVDHIISTDVLLSRPCDSGSCVREVRC